MRVIAGTARGRRLRAPDTRSTRPMTDRAREGLFSSLGEAVIGARVLDLFAGSGSLGIEALSRGAAWASFVELGTRALAALRTNIEACGFASRSTVIARPVARFLGSAPGGSVDLLFLDPPWTMPEIEQQQTFDLAGPLLAPGGLMVVHRPVAAPPLEVPPSLELDTAKRYGDGKIWMYMKRYGADSERPGR